MAERGECEVKPTKAGEEIYEAHDSDERKSSPTLIQTLVRSKDFFTGRAAWFAVEDVLHQIFGGLRPTPVRAPRREWVANLRLRAPRPRDGRGGRCPRSSPSSSDY